MTDTDDTRTNEGPHRAGLRVSGRSYAHVAQRIFNTPLLIDPKKLHAIIHAIGPRLDLDVEQPAAGWPMERRAFDPAWSGWDRELYASIESGVAVVEVTGTLVHKGAWLGSYSGLTSYDGISEQLARIRERAATGEVRALLLNIHSGGGEVAGCFDLVDEIFAMRGSMPIVALAADAANSAAYAIASAADEIVVTQTGEVGSVGVVMTHYDYTQAAEKMGVRVTHIHAGKDKVLGTPFRPLSEADQARLQAEVDALYSVFVDKVARNRGMDPQSVRDTEAGVFLADAAVRAGLADRVASGRQVLEELISRVSPGAASRLYPLTTGGQTMTTTNKPNAAAAETIPATAEQIAAARAEGVAEGKAIGAKEGATAERARVKAIVTHPEAEGRTDMASHLAFDTDLSADASVALLAKSPKAQPAAQPAAASPLDRAMAAVGTPGVRAEEAPSTDTPASPSIDAQSIFQRRASR